METPYIGKSKITRYRVHSTRLGYPENRARYQVSRYRKNTRYPSRDDGHGHGGDQLAKLEKLELETSSS
jgi:hypothetical protein